MLQYFHKHFPKAIETAAAARAKGSSYSWLTHSWLINVYRHCSSTKVNIHGPKEPSALVCPNQTALDAIDGETA